MIKQREGAGAGSGAGEAASSWAGSLCHSQPWHPPPLPTPSRAALSISLDPAWLPLRAPPCKGRGFPWARLAAGGVASLAPLGIALGGQGRCLQVPCGGWLTHPTAKSWGCPDGLSVNPRTHLLYVLVLVMPPQRSCSLVWRWPRLAFGALHQLVGRML